MQIKQKQSARYGIPGIARHAGNSRDGSLRIEFEMLHVPAAPTAAVSAQQQQQRSNSSSSSSQRRTPIEGENNIGVADHLCFASITASTRSLRSTPSLADTSLSLSLPLSPSSPSTTSGVGSRPKPPLVAVSQRLWCAVEALAGQDEGGTQTFLPTAPLRKALVGQEWEGDPQLCP